MKSTGTQAGQRRAAPGTVSGQLADRGYVVIEGIGGLPAAEELLVDLGTVMPQYDGEARHEVRYRPGFDDRSYSQSTNTIKAHTEAPGWDPSPAWLALYCHRQARCGGGHTDLLDFRDVETHLSADERQLLHEPLWFPAPPISGGPGVKTALVSGEAPTSVVRFSYNLLTAADYDPPLQGTVPENDLPLGRPGRELAEQVARLFVERRHRVLVPDGALLVWDNQRMLHARSRYEDRARHLTRFWVQREAA